MANNTNFIIHLSKIKRAFKSGLDTYEVAKKLGYKYLGSGVTRVVYDTGEFVVKYQYNDYNIAHTDCNKSEYNMYRVACKDGYKHLFAQALYISPCGKFLVMEKMTRTANSNYNKYMQVRKEINKIYPFIHDLHEGNIMANEAGQMKATDYGCDLRNRY